MAGDLTGAASLAHCFEFNASKTRSTIDEIFRKYNREFPNDDTIELRHQKIVRNRGAVKLMQAKKIGCVTFGKHDRSNAEISPHLSLHDSHSVYTGESPESSEKSFISANCSRWVTDIEQESEPSDAETLSSDTNEDDDSDSWEDEEEIVSQLESRETDSEADWHCSEQGSDEESKWLTVGNRDHMRMAKTDKRPAHWNRNPNHSAKSHHAVPHRSVKKLSFGENHTSDFTRGNHHRAYTAGKSTHKSTRETVTRRAPNSWDVCQKPAIDRIGPPRRVRPVQLFPSLNDDTNTTDRPSFSAAMRQDVTDITQEASNMTDMLTPGRVPKNSFQMRSALRPEIPSPPSSSSVSLLDDVDFVSSQHQTEIVHVGGPPKNDFSAARMAVSEENGSFPGRFETEYYGKPAHDQKGSLGCMQSPFTSNALDKTFTVVMPSSSKQTSLKHSTICSPVRSGIRKCVPRTDEQKDQQLANSAGKKEVLWKEYGSSVVEKPCVLKSVPPVIATAAGDAPQSKMVGDVLLSSSIVPSKFSSCISPRSFLAILGAEGSSQQQTSLLPHDDLQGTQVTQEMTFEQREERLAEIRRKLDGLSNRLTHNKSPQKSCTSSTTNKQWINQSDVNQQDVQITPKTSHEVMQPSVCELQKKIALPHDDLQGTQVIQEMTFEQREELLAEIQRKLDGLSNRLTPNKSPQKSCTSSTTNKQWINQSDVNQQDMQSTPTTSHKVMQTSLCELQKKIDVLSRNITPKKTDSVESVCTPKKTDSVESVCTPMKTDSMESVCTPTKTDSVVSVLKGTEGSGTHKLRKEDNITPGKKDFQADGLFAVSNMVVPKVECKSSPCTSPRHKSSISSPFNQMTNPFSPLNVKSPEQRTKVRQKFQPMYESFSAEEIQEVLEMQDSNSVIKFLSEKRIGTESQSAQQKLKREVSSSLEQSGEKVNATCFQHSPLPESVSKRHLMLSQKLPHKPSDNFIKEGTSSPIQNKLSKQTGQNNTESSFQEHQADQNIWKRSSLHSCSQHASFENKGKCQNVPPEQCMALENTVDASRVTQASSKHTPVQYLEILGETEKWEEQSMEHCPSRTAFSPVRHPVLSTSSERQERQHRTEAGAQFTQLLPELRSHSDGAARDQQPAKYVTLSSALEPDPTCLSFSPSSGSHQKQRRSTGPAVHKIFTQIKQVIDNEKTQQASNSPDGQKPLDWHWPSSKDSWEHKVSYSPSMDEVNFLKEDDVVYLGKECAPFSVGSSRGQEDLNQQSKKALHQEQNVFRMDCQGNPLLQMNNINSVKVKTPEGAGKQKDMKGSTYRTSEKSRWGAWCMNTLSNFEDSSYTPERKTLTESDRSERSSVQQRKWPGLDNEMFGRTAVSTGTTSCSKKHSQTCQNDRVYSYLQGGSDDNSVVSQSQGFVSNYSTPSKLLKKLNLNDPHSSLNCDGLSRLVLESPMKRETPEKDKGKECRLQQKRDDVYIRSNPTSSQREVHSQKTFKSRQGRSLPTAKSFTPGTSGFKVPPEKKTEECVVLTPPPGRRGNMIRISSPQAKQRNQNSHNFSSKSSNSFLPTVFSKRSFESDLSETDCVTSSCRAAHKKRRLNVIHGTSTPSKMMKSSPGKFDMDGSLSTISGESSDLNITVQSAGSCDLGDPYTNSEEEDEVTLISE